MLKNHDWVLFVIIIILTITGLFSLFTTGILPDGQITFSDTLGKQIIFSIIGILFYFIISSTDYQYLKHYQITIILTILIIIILIITKLWGPVINYSQRWIIIAGIQIQPSEIAKLVVIINTLSIMMSNINKNEWIRLIITAVPALIITLLVYIQPSGSVAAIILFLWGISILFTFNDRKRLMLLMLIFLISILIPSLVKKFFLLSIILIIFLIFINIFLFYKNDILKRVYIIVSIVGLLFGLVISNLGGELIFEHQINRIEAYLNVDLNDRNLRFNVNQSIIAIGNGQIFGKGLGAGTQSRLNFLPEHQTDFIFASFSEQFGLFGSLIVVTLYALLVYKIISISTKIKENFSSIFILILGIKILVEIFINIGTNTGLIPATGIPLPLMSAGGTITIMTFIILGIIQSVQRINAELYIFDNDRLLS